MISSSDFVFLAAKGFGLGFGIGFLTWGISFAVRTLRRSVFSALKIIDAA